MLLYYINLYKEYLHIYPMHYRKGEKQHIANLIEISGGLPKKRITDKIDFYAVFIMNGILYNESQAREEVESMRDVRKSLLEDL